MRIVVVGGGNTGRHLAAKLCKEKHDVVIIDADREALTEIESQLDILTIEGPGSCPAILQKAEIEKTDLLVAVTNSDEVNILAGQFAHLAGVPNAAVRVSDTRYINSPERYNLNKLGIELVISEEAESAREIYNIIQRPGTQEVIDLFGGRVQAVGLRINADSKLLYQPLKDFPDKALIQTIRFIAIMRGDQLILPSGETRFLIGDEVYFIGQPEDLNNFIGWSDPEHFTFQKVIIAGGGDVGMRLAQMMEKTSISVTLVEKDEDRAHDCSRLLNKALVIRGDALEHDTLEATGIHGHTAFVAATQSDEENIMSCLVAEKLGASFTLARVNRPEYVPVINTSSLLDRAISPHVTTINAILRYVRGQNVRSATLFQGLPGELLEFNLPQNHKWIGQKVKDLKIPDGELIAAIFRGNEVHIATGDFAFAEGDRMIFFSKQGAFKKLVSLFKF